VFRFEVRRLLVVVFGNILIVLNYRRTFEITNQKIIVEHKVVNTACLDDIAELHSSSEQVQILLRALLPST